MSNRMNVVNVLEGLYREFVSRIVLDRVDRLIEVPMDVEDVVKIVEEVLGVEAEYFDCGDPVEDQGIVGYVATKDGVRIVLWQSVFENEPTTNTIIRLFDNAEEAKEYVR
ncbi:MAG: hypothetical protein GXO10_04355 [Crenarchaeota archaeon]|nr:hypothetical protein [Thermoproteota archaeon]